MDNEVKMSLPTENVELPSKGLLYPLDNPLSSGVVEMKYMTAKEEDILSNQNYLKDGTVFDKLLKSLIVSKINYDDLTVGDKNAILIAARILGYGKDYKVTFTHPITGEEEVITIDLAEMKNKEIDYSLFKNNNEFTFTLPTTDNVVTFKLLSHGDEKRIEQEIKGMQKINKDNITEATTRLKHIITSINGSADKNDIREFVDFGLLARDARALREEYNKTSPDIDLNFTYVDSDGTEREAVLPITITFFWPES